MSTTVASLMELDSFAEMETPPANWEGAMKALIAGAVDHAEIEPLIMACASVAHELLEAERPRLQAESAKEGKMCIAPTWLYVGEVLAEQCTGGEGVPDNLAAQLLHMGQVADSASKT